MAGLTKEQMQEVKTYKIYKHTLPNGKSYIGMTNEEKDYKRFQYGCGYSKNEEFHRDIYELGWRQIKTEILAEVYGTWYEGHVAEVAQIQKAIANGEELYNKDHIKLPKEPKYKLEGCTILETNTYYPTLTAAAAFIGVTKAAVSCALKENRCCKGWSLEYGDVTIKEEK